MATYTIRIRTEPCELPGVTFVTEADEVRGYCSQSPPEGGERAALAAIFDALALMMNEAGPEQVAEDLARWREDA